MAKHPHRLMLNQKKTWRCTLPGCKYFIHIGLAHILPGMQSICWECGEEFTLDDVALKDDQPTCNSCRSHAAGRLSANEMEDIINAQMALSKAGVKKVSELNPTQLGTLKAMGVLKDTAIKRLEEADEIEVIEEHAPDCDTYMGRECNCGLN